MRRYWSDSLLLGQDSYLIEGDLFKHIHKVCRQSLNDHFELMGPQGIAVLVEVVHVGKKSLKAKFISKRNLPSLKSPYIHLMLSVPKMKALEAIVEKSVELGVYSLQIFTSEFSFMQSKSKVENRRERLNKIIRSACQQSARSHVLRLPKVLSFSEILDAYKLEPKPQTQALAFYEGQAKSLEELGLFLGCSKAKESPFGHLWLFVGSEGGFSRSEVDAFKWAQIPSLSLGEQVLRVETACVMAVSILKYKLGLC